MLSYMITLLTGLLSWFCCLTCQYSSVLTLNISSLCPADRLIQLLRLSLGLSAVFSLYLTTAHRAGPGGPGVGLKEQFYSVVLVTVIQYFLMTDCHPDGAADCRFSGCFSFTVSSTRLVHSPLTSGFTPGEQRGLRFSSCGSPPAVLLVLSADFLLCSCNNECSH